MAVGSRAQSLLRARIRPSLADAVVLSIVAAIGVLDISDVDPAVPAWQMAASLVWTLGMLAFRHRAPALALLGILAAQAVVHSPDASNDPAHYFFAVMVASFEVGRLRPLRVAIPALVATIVFFAAFNLLRDEGVAAAVFGGLLFQLTLGAGIVLRQTVDRRDQLEVETERLALERDQSVQAAVTDERARIAREMHDSVAHSVSVMVLQAGVVRSRLDADHEPDAELLRQVERAGREAVVELRRMVGIIRKRDEHGELAPPSLARVPELVERLRDGGARVTLQIEGEPRQLTPGLELSAYRIVQEALTNVLRHAGAAPTRVLVRYGSAALQIEVVDDGPGTPENGHGDGHGVIGMRERVALYGGDFEAGPLPAGGYAVRASLPIRAAPA